MSDYLAHYGRKGMKWGKNIFEDLKWDQKSKDLRERSTMGKIRDMQFEVGRKKSQYGSEYTPGGRLSNAEARSLNPYQKLAAKTATTAVRGLEPKFRELNRSAATVRLSRMDAANRLERSAAFNKMKYGSASKTELGHFIAKGKAKVQKFFAALHR